MYILFTLVPAILSVVVQHAMTLRVVQYACICDFIICIAPILGEN